MDESTILELRGVRKMFGSTEALAGIDLAVQKGEFLTLLGSSGCGKTTTLRIIAGLEYPDEGRVFLNGQDVTDTEPNRRNVNTVFQSYALFPHMNVYNNIAYGLKLKKTPKAEIRAKVEQMLSLVQLAGFGKRMPNELSGGQRQRIAIARAIVGNPSVLLLDEPLGALDLKLRRQMQVELKDMQQTLGITFVYITHDQEEALNMSDRIGVMKDGALLQLGTPDEIYERPQSRYVAEFIGQSNMLRAVVDRKERGALVLSLPAGNALAAGEGKPGERVILSVRTERIRYGIQAPEGFALPAVIKQLNYTGGVSRTVLILSDGTEVVASGFGGNEDRLPVGTRVFVWWDPEFAVIVERGDGI